MGGVAPRLDPLRRCLAVEAWPLPDQRAWRDVLNPGDPLEPGGACAAWRPCTVAGVRSSYGRWLTWLQLRRPGELARDVAERASPGNVAAYVEELRGLNASSTVLHRVDKLRMALRALCPHGDWRWLHRLVARLKRTVQPVRPKRPRLRTSGELFSFGLRLIRDAELLAAAPWRRAVQHRDGLLIALLAARPIRRRNLASIELGRHLLSVAGGYALCFAGSETKNGAALEFPLPASLVPHLARYLEHHRPVLLCPRGPRAAARRVCEAEAHLWVSPYGTPLVEGALYWSITRRTAAEFGKALNPHLFRDCAATSIAVEDPDHVRIIPSILGHDTLATSEKHYNHAQTLVACCRYQEQVRRLRGQKGVVAQTLRVALREQGIGTG